LQAQEGRLLNLSLIKTQDEGLPEFEDAYLLLNGMESTWAIHNSNPDKDEDPKLVVQELTKNEWNQILKKYITSCEGNL
jgi:hypothetical protein